MISELNDLATLIAEHDSARNDADQARALGMLLTRTRKILPQVLERLVDVETKLTEHARAASTAFVERDRMSSRVDACEASIAFWRRTKEYLPAIGVCCDEPTCTNAIGVVGIKMAGTDAMGPLCVEIAKLAGWSVTMNDQLVHKHWCPMCTKERGKR